MATKGLLRARAVAMDGVGHQFFAGPALALNQDGRIGGRDPANEVEHFAHAGTSAHHVVFQFDFGAQFLVLLPQLFPVLNVVKGQAGDARDCGHDLQDGFRRTRPSGLQLSR